MQRIVPRHRRLASAVLAGFVALSASAIGAEEAAAPAAAEAAPAAAPDLMNQTPEQVAAKNAGCIACHKATDSASMHTADLPIACVDCHGGNPQGTTKETAHVAPSDPELFKTSGFPARLNAAWAHESLEWVRFVNPSDLRVAAQTCGQSSCHTEEVGRVRRSMMTHGASLYAAALYNNGSFPLKNAILGESYSPDGIGQAIFAHKAPSAEETKKKGILPVLFPLPRWEISQPGNTFRIFERGGRRPAELGTFDPFELDPPGKPERRQSARGYGTGFRTDPVVIGAQKTRLLDPLLSFPGTNDHPGDYRSSGCAGCHVVYANDRDPLHSGPWARYGNGGRTASVDPTIPTTEPGHPVQHKFTTAIPSSQCIVCHIHPGTNMVMTYFGTMWWDNETDAAQMYPEKDKEPGAAERVYGIEPANPEGSAIRGKWSDPKFLDNLTDLNPRLQKTQFADFHGHGWIYRKIFKQDRKGNLLDGRGKVVPWDDPERFKKSVHLQDIHAEKGMHCIDCHFEQDSHGNGQLYGEVRNAIEIGCIDCHGTIQRYADPTEKSAATSGPAGPSRMQRYMNTTFGPRFFKKDGKLFQRSAVNPDVSWEVVQTRDSIDPASPYYNEGSRLAKTIRKDGKTWGSVPEQTAELAHADENITCFACHTSWMTSCFGCHLSQMRNRRTPMLHYEGVKATNWTSYNFQVLRDDAFMLGKDGSVIGGRVSPVRSSSAVIVSSQNVNREWFYAQQQTVSAEGYSGQAMNTHVPHTVRATETKSCPDCHVSSKGDNNAQMAQLLLLGTQFVNFFGRYVYVGTGEHGLEAVAVTERDEPQAVIGSELHKYAYPARYEAHLKHERELTEAYEHPGNDVGDVSWLTGHPGEVRSLQLRGEYLYAANGPGGLRVYDVANIDQKGFSERIVSAPVSPLGQRLYVATKDATSVAAPTTLTVDASRKRLDVNEEQPIHPLYRYLYVTDREEGLILVDAATLFDGNPDNNFLERALTFNPKGRLSGAVNVVLIGVYAYVATDHGLEVVDLDDPLQPKITAEIAAPVLDHPTAIDHQFRYAFVCDRIGVKVLDITDIAHPKPVDGASVDIADARDVYVARTYAYVAAGAQGLVILDVEKPEKPKVDQIYNAEGKINDATAVRVGMTNASAYAYVADGHNGLRVLQLTSPEMTPGNYGFSPRPTPRLIATRETAGPAIALSKGLDRDRGVDESGNQLVVFGRRGGRPFNQAEMRRMYIRDGALFTVTDGPPDEAKELPFKEAAVVATTETRPPAAREVPGVRLRERGGVELKERGGVELREEGGVRLNEPQGGVELRGK
jgi:hypothetical protein